MLVGQATIVVIRLNQLLFSFQYNDVAILTLANCANTQSNVAKPICLPTGDKSFVGDKVTVAGWGALSSGEAGLRVPSKRIKVIPLYSNSCRKKTDSK